MDSLPESTGLEILWNLTSADRIHLLVLIVVFKALVGAIDDVNQIDSSPDKMLMPQASSAISCDGVEEQMQ